MLKFLSIDVHHPHHPPGTNSVEASHKLLFFLNDLNVSNPFSVKVKQINRRGKKRERERRKKRQLRNLGKFYLVA